MLNTDFSTTEKIRTETSLDFSDFPSPHYVEYRVPDVCYTFESLLGKRALKVVWGDSLLVDKENPRPSIIVFNAPTEYWIQEELYIPSDFKLKNWMSIGQPFLGDYNTFPRFSSPIYLQGSGGDGTGNVRIRNELNYITEGYVVNNLWNSGNLEGIVKRGKSLIIRAHVKLDAVNGVFEVWFNGQKVTDYKGQTITDAANEIQPIGHYKRVDEPVTSLYWRNLRIEEYNFFDEIPEEPPEQPPEEPPVQAGFNPVLAFTLILLLAVLVVVGGEKR